MDAKIEQHGNVVVVRLSGYLDFESADALRNAFLKHLTDAPIVFNLRGLNFVGSSGITPFVDTLSELAGKNTVGVKFCGVGTEFRRVFMASPIRGIEIHEDEERARLSFAIPYQNFTMDNWPKLAHDGRPMPDYRGVLFLTDDPVDSPD